MTTWTFAAAGAATGQHRHEFDYVVVPITGGRFEVVDLDGSVRVMNQVAGSPYLGTAGTAHDVVSAAAHEAVFVEIELKRTAIAASANVDPTIPALAAIFGANYGFMLPVSTPPNASVYSSGMLPITRMIKAGGVFDIIGMVLCVIGVVAMANLVGLA